MRHLISAVFIGTVISGPALAEGSRLHGFYIGAFGGLAVLDSTVNLPATDSTPNVKLVDQGGDGFIFGLRAGWGTNFNHSGYAGIEVEGILPNNVRSRMMAMGVEYTAHMRGEVGFYGRLGWAPDENSMIFLRAGAAAFRQSFTNSRGTGESTEWDIVPAIGVGMETHLTRNLLVRIDFHYTGQAGMNAMEAYHVTAGLAWRF